MKKLLFILLSFKYIPILKIYKSGCLIEFIKAYKAYFKILVFKKFQKNIFVFAPCQVACGAINKTIFKNAKYPIFMGHFLNPQTWEKYSLNKKPIYKLARYCISLTAIKLSKYYKFSWLFITGVREPFSHAMSMFFYNIDKGKKKLSYPIKSFLETNFSMTNELVNEFEEYIKINKCSHIDNWFKNEFSFIFKINLDKFSEIKNKGYCSVINGNTEILMYRFEDIHRLWPEISKKFLNKETVLEDLNLTTNKPCASAYSWLKQNYKFKEEILDKVYSFDYIKLFYTEEEIKQFKEKWEKIHE